MFPKTTIILFSLLVLSWMEFVASRFDSSHKLVQLKSSNGKARIVYPDEDDDDLTKFTSSDGDFRTGPMRISRFHPSVVKTIDILEHLNIPSEAYNMESPRDSSNIQLAFPTLLRTEQIADDSFEKPSSKFLKTGTTIVGLKTKDCIILAADTRATEGSVVADTRCEKVHQLSHNIWCCGAGTSADLDALTRKIRYMLLLKSMSRDNVGNDYISVSSFPGDQFRSQEEDEIKMTLGEASISSVCTMIREELYRAQGSIGANIVLGGIDQFNKAPVLAAIHPHGSIDIIPYTALGSGGLAAMGVLEVGFKQEMSLEDGISLVKEAVLAGIKNDLGSGSQVDICIIERNSVTYTRAIVEEEMLLLSQDDNTVAEYIHNRHINPDTTSVGGVNGFGALPFEVQSRKILVLNEAHIDMHRRKWIQDVINS